MIKRACVDNVLSSLDTDAVSKRNLYLGLAFGGAALLWAMNKSSSSPRPLKGAPKMEVPTDDLYDVAIIGAGPSGAVCAYYLAKAGRKVLLLEKAKFPRDKICGDAITSAAQGHLREMGVLQPLLDEGKCHWAQSGGLVSPAGYSFIGNSAKEVNRPNEGLVVAIKRIDLDERIARATERAGAHLLENTEVMDADFDASRGEWDIRALQNEKTEVKYRARVLVAADGTPSKFARSKGIVNSEPQGVCSRAYVTGDHSFQSDGVVFYPYELLPGYICLLRHANNMVGISTYIIPGGDAANADLPRLHHDMLQNYNFIATTIAGKDTQVERMKAGGLRIGGISKSYADNLLIIGDAAGFIDPLTGEGIQYAMDSGHIASEVIVRGLHTGDLSARVMKEYHSRWYSQWGRDFYWSMKVSALMYRFPIMLDAAAKMIQRRGSRFLAEYAYVMTGAGSKLWFLRPDVGPLLLLEAVGIGIQRLFGFAPPKPTRNSIPK